MGGPNTTPCLVHIAAVGRINFNRRFQKMKKSKSIRAKIALCMGMTVLISLLVVEAASVWLNFSSTHTTVTKMMEESVTLVSSLVEQQLLSFKNVAMDTGYIPQLSDPDINTEELSALLDQRVEMHGFTRANIIDTNFHSIFNGQDFSDRDYLQEAMKGNVTVSEPLISKVTGKLSIIVAAPIWQGGIPNTKVTGVVYFVPPETFLNDIVSTIHISENSGAYMINKNGDTIADTTMDTIMTQNIENEAKTDKSLTDLAKIHSLMRKGESGFGSYSIDGVSKFLAYAPVGGTDGWSIAVSSYQSDYLSGTYAAIYVTLGIVAVFVIIAFVIATWLSKSIGLPMRACAQRMQALVQGDLDSPVPESSSQDETGMLTAAAADLTHALRTIIGDIDELLAEMAGKNLDVRSQNEDAYVGGFSNIILSIRNLRINLSQTLKQINSAAEQVSGGSEQVSIGAQALSQGSVEQASSVEELAGAVSEISSRVQNTADGAAAARLQTNSASEEIGKCNQQMNELMHAMEDIRSSSDEISKIIKTIEDIAFQTNILALNAAVEAARAGVAGKGFAVVAGEVRNLAGKSAEASQSTAQLIQRSAEAVHKGEEISSSTAETMRKAVESMQSVVDLIDKIAVASSEQSEKIRQVSSGIDQISSVVHTNSATAEQSAAASQQLSAEAQSLKQLVGQFTLSRDLPADRGEY